MPVAAGGSDRSLQPPDDRRLLFDREGVRIQRTLGHRQLRLATELALREGKEQWAAAAPDADGIRRVTVPGVIDDALRVRAQAFCSQGRAVFLALSQDPPSVLLAASADAGVHAGERVKAAVTAAGGQGGGNSALAQGSLPGGSDLDAIAEALLLP